MYVREACDAVEDPAEAEKRRLKDLLASWRAAQSGARPAVRVPPARRAAANAAGAELCGCAGAELDLVGRRMSGPCAAPSLPASLQQPLMRLAQSFVLSDPSQPDCPIVYASQGFLELTRCAPAAAPRSAGRCPALSCHGLKGSRRSLNATSHPIAARQASPCTPIHYDALYAVTGDQLRGVGRVMIRICGTCGAGAAQSSTPAAQHAVSGPALRHAIRQMKPAGTRARRCWGGIAAFCRGPEPARARWHACARAWQLGAPSPCAALCTALCAAVLLLMRHRL